MDSKFVGQPALEQDSLETLLATEPTSTDLDLLAGLETTSDCQQDTKLEQATSVVEADQQKTSGNNSKTSSNDEDSLTVRYFPIVKMATQSATRQTVQDYANYGGQQQQAPINETTPRPAACNRQQLQQQQQNRTQLANLQQQDQEAKVRIVEHVRKNLTLFESNRQIYELGAGDSCEARGHLQSLLEKKLSSSSSTTTTTTTAAGYNNLANARKLIDQYTQYRASDLTGIDNNSRIEVPKQVANQKRVNDQLANQQQVPLRDQAKALTKKHDTLPASSRLAKDTALRRSVGAISDLIKRQLEFVRKTRGQSESVQQEQQQQQQQQASSGNDNQEQQYKVPAKQLFVASQSLYLLPTPDYRVHIATRSVKDIILAYQRALKKNSEQTNYGQTFRSKQLLSLLGGSYRAAKTTNNNRSRRVRLARVVDKPVAESTGRQTTRGKLQASFSSVVAKQPTLDHSVGKLKAKVKMPSGKSDKATILDNKDGTIKISYEPKEVGQHEISLRYNDEPIDESPVVFYVDAVGASKKKITAYGCGLTRGNVGEPCKFTINTGGFGSSKLNVAVEGPGKTQVSLGDNKDGTISVNYVPLTSGEYKIKISFDGKQLVGSPFTTLIGDEGRQRSQISVGRGSEHSLDFKVSEDDLKTLNAVISTPSGVEEPCGVKLLKTGQLAIVFTPREQGEHMVNVKRFGNHISGSPFKFDVLSRDIGDAKQVRVSGSGLKEAKTNTESELIINTREAGYGGLSVSLEGPGRTEIKSKDTADGNIKLSYVAYEPGEYSLIVKYADHVVPGSPFNIKVTGQGTNPQKESLKKFRKAAQQVDANQECSFSFKMPGVSAYDLSARLNSPQGHAEDVSIKDKGDFVYQITFVPKETGLYTLSVRNKEIHIAGSPFPFTIGPALSDVGAHKVRCGGQSLIRGSCNKWNEFNVFTREAGAGELTVIVEGPSKPELSYTDRRDGSCHVGYKVSSPGEYRVSVLFNDQEVPDSPFRVIIMPHTGDVAKIELGPMPPESMIQLNKPCNLTVIMNGAKGNIEAKVRLPSGGQFEDCFASPIDAENWGVRFIPREIGVHQVHIKFNKGSSHIPQSPVLIRVGHDQADPAAVLAHGNGLKEAKVNLATDFVVETCNAGHALLEVNIEGPTKVSMGCCEVDEGYRVNYTPLAPGDYLISIKYNGCHVAGSPFKVRAIKQVGARTVADPGAHEISTLSIATTDREAKQKVENMPKFKSDATKVYCKGMGLKKAYAGKLNTLTVNCSEAGFNMISASFLGPTRNTIHECSVKHMGGSIYEVKYNCKDKGDAVLVIKYGDEMVAGSPFRLECV